MFATDAVGAEFWWKATQEGITLRGERRTWPEADVGEFLDVFDPLFRPSELRKAPLGRELGSRHASLVGLPLSDVLYTMTGKDRDALISSRAGALRVTFESFDIADLHVIAGAIDNGANVLCSSDRDHRDLGQIGSLRIVAPSDLAVEVGLVTPPVPTGARQPRV